MSLRRSTFGIILFALALLSRIALPLAASAAPFDPLAGAPICSHGGSSQTPSNHQDGTHQDSGHCAFACCHSVAGPMTDAAPSLFAPVVFSAVAWRPAQLAAIHSHAVLRQRARGPPSLS